MSSADDPAEAFRAGELAIGSGDLERAEEAAHEALSRVRKLKQERERGGQSE